MEAALGSVLWLFAAWGVARAVLDLRRLWCRDAVEFEEFWVRALLIGLATIATAVAVLGGLGLLGRWQCVGWVCLMLLIARVWQTREHAPIAKPPPLEESKLFSLGLLLTLLVLLLEATFWLPLPDVGWDAATYHLYFPARWLQEGRLFHIPTVFSDNSAAYAPQNGALIQAFSMALLGHDAPANVLQLVALAMTLLSLLGLAKELGVAWPAALCAALSLCWLPPVRAAVFTAEVDLWMVGCCSALWFLGLRAWRQPSLERWSFAGLAAGFALGTKTIGLPLVALSAAPVVVGVCRRLVVGGGLRALLPALLAALTMIAGGGWWYVKNLLLYRNPLFPLHFELLGITFEGAYNYDAVKASEFRLNGFVEVMASVTGQWGIGTVFLTLLGGVILASWGVFRRRGRGVALLFCGTAIAWAFYFVAICPHNNQARFLLPLLILASLGWSRLLDEVPSPTARAVWFLMVLGVWLESRPWESWRWLLTATELGGGALPLLLCLVIAAVAALLRRRHGVTSKLRKWGLVALTATFPGLALFQAVLMSETVRPFLLSQADYRRWASGYLPLASVGTEHLRIAYTGANVPYALMGPSWRHRVFYVNLDGTVDRSLYDYWKRQPHLDADYKAALYRTAANPSAWLEGLSTAKVDFVAVFHVAEGQLPQISADANGFPVERSWIRARPDLFRPYLGSPVAEIYELRARSKDH